HVAEEVQERRPVPEVGRRQLPLQVLGDVDLVFEVVPGVAGVPGEAEHQPTRLRDPGHLHRRPPLRQLQPPTARGGRRGGPRGGRGGQWGRGRCLAAARRGGGGGGQGWGGARDPPGEEGGGGCSGRGGRAQGGGGGGEDVRGVSRRVGRPGLRLERQEDAD